MVEPLKLIGDSSVSTDGHGPTPRLYIYPIRPRRPLGLWWHMHWTHTDYATWNNMRNFLQANPDLLSND